MLPILVVDDDDLMRGAIADILHDAGYVAVEAENGLAAAAQLAARDIGLIVTDISMPERDGLELIRDGALAGQRIPVIAISANNFAGVDLLSAARAFGAVAVLQKPFRADTLLRLVEQVYAGETIGT